ncbi:MAG: DUF2079 domain-containing protein, partial [Planctomycetota bacterium]|nr:DUF2079 domain-containing protein [Planctomycetota bacterium]
VTATRFFSSQTWQNIVGSLGGQIHFNPVNQSATGDVPFLPLFLILAVLSTLSLAAFGAVVRLKASRPPQAGKLKPAEQIKGVCIAGWRWWLIPWCWELIQLLIYIGGFETITAFMTAIIFMSAMYHYIMAVSLAGWMTELIVPLIRQGVTQSADHVSDGQSQPESHSGIFSVPVMLLVGLVTYVAVFTIMNWQLYRGLLVPHGDSVMYEEHLWNVLHGKGFRSYLDQGLFLGEHIQVIHVALLPLYAIWPSHLLLEACESVALASGAIPVFWIARRCSGSTRTALCLAFAYLLYPPLQFLDIAIDLKTFRPICFGVPALLFALDQLERGRVKMTVILVLMALASKEDFALVLGPLGLWLAAQPFLNRTRTVTKDLESRPELLTSKKLATRYGIGLTLAAVGYLLLTTRVLIPWFRGGAEVHYARYFAKFGDSLGDIVLNMLTQPGLLVQELVTVSSISYLLALMLPLGFLPLLALSRCAVAIPILGLLCLNEIIKADPQPWHHFHAPVVPILFWAAAHAVAKFREASGSVIRFVSKHVCSDDTRYVPVFVLTLCCFVGVTVGMSPLSIRFWDAGSFYYWRSLYVPSERALKFNLVREQIPQDACVASTDFVHPRFTHYKRSYDYSHYLRKVAGYESRVPDDADYIVIDTQHYYSDVKRPDQVRELQMEPETWELLKDRTDGYFIILKRRQ